MRLLPKAHPGPFNTRLCWFAVALMISIACVDVIIIIDAKIDIDAPPAKGGESSGSCHLRTAPFDRMT